MRSALSQDHGQFWTWWLAFDSVVDVQEAATAASPASVTCCFDVCGRPTRTLLLCDLLSPREIWLAHCTAVLLQGGLHHCKICDLLRLFWGSTLGFFAESSSCCSTSSWYCPRWYSNRVWLAHPPLITLTLRQQDTDSDSVPEFWKLPRSKFFLRFS